MTIAVAVVTAAVALAAAVVDVVGQRAKSSCGWRGRARPRLGTYPAPGPPAPHTNCWAWPPSSHSRTIPFSELGKVLRSHWRCAVAGFGGSTGCGPTRSTCPGRSSASPFYTKSACLRSLRQARRYRFGGGTRKAEKKQSSTPPGRRWGGGEGAGGDRVSECRRLRADTLKFADASLTD